LPDNGGFIHTIPSEKNISKGPLYT